MSEDEDEKRERLRGWIIPVFVGVITGLLLALTGIAEKEWPSWAILTLASVVAALLVGRLKRLP